MPLIRVLSTALATLALSLAYAQAPAPAAAPAAPAPPIPPAPAPQGAQAWLLMDFASGQVLASGNPDERREPASLTKVMTAYVVAETIRAGRVRLDDPVLLSERAWREGGAATEGSFSGFELNSRTPLEEMLKGMAVQSGNDAAIALAEHVAGSQEAFAALMNDAARRLGMRNSHFVNAHGLSAPEHYSSARDMAILAQALIRDFPEIYAHNRIRELTINGITQPNRNTLLWRDETVDGIKTGHTQAAGYCLMASAQRNGMRLISVVMGIEAPNGTAGFRLREDGNLNLLNWGFRSYESRQLYAALATVATPSLWKGEVEQVKLGLAEPLLVTVPRGRGGELRASMELPRQIVAPIARGQVIGKVRVMLDGRLVAERPLVALEPVAEAGFFGRLWDEFWMWWESD
jgi:D-alanyl-D-alanine carboxypeptidase (penicillin-binding protein 5/6)